MGKFDLQFTTFPDGTIRIIRSQGEASILPEPVCVDYQKPNTPYLRGLGKDEQQEWARCELEAGWRR